MKLRVVYRKDEYRRVVRGGGWGASASSLRSTFRGTYNYQPYEDNFVGARLSKSLGGKSETKSSLQ